VIKRFLETFFRHKLLILLPVIVIPLIVTPVAFFLVRPYYETYVSVWVDRPTWLKASDGWSNYLTPAQNQNTRLADMLRTRSFRADAARRTSLAPLVDTPQGDAQIREYFDRNVTIQPSGTNLLTLRARGETPQLAVELADALVATFREQSATQRVNQASVAIGFFEARANEAEEELNKANEGIRRYVAANPRLTTIDPTRGAGATTASRLGLPAVAIDPQLAEHMHRVELSQREVENVRAQLEQARFEASASLEGQDLGFQVLDTAQTPTNRVIEARRLLVYPAAGLVAGLIITIGLLVVLVATDRSVRTDQDLAPGVRVLGVVPLLKVDGLPNQVGPHSARRAIGYVAGAALPAPRETR
jgi:capsular polysaccharide biosynthesis protein